MRLPFLNAGLAAPEVRTACELGFGQGVSTNIHAACSTTQWWGTDFNPAQAAFAREVGAVSKADVRLYDEAFAEFCQRGDLPEFDFVGLHGIWSWISEQNRAVIVDFIRRKLKVGGVLYISYNTMPGWAAMVPLRQLLTEHAEVMAAPGRGTVARIDAALEFADKLLATNPLAARAQPQIADRIKLLKGQNRHYLAHEYFNRDWQPMPIAEMGRWLGDAKMSYACSAHYLDLVDAINLSPEQQAFLAEIPDAMFRETARDFMVNQQFRRDYWVKGARRLSKLEQVESLRKQRLMLVQERAGVSLKAKGAIGEGAMHEGLRAHSRCACGA
jgi:SAM-dependent methyltransferase